MQGLFHLGLKKIFHRFNIMVGAQFNFFDFLSGGYIKVSVNIAQFGLFCVGEWFYFLYPSFATKSNEVFNFNHDAVAHK